MPSSPVEELSLMYQVEIWSMLQQVLVFGSLWNLVGLVARVGEDYPREWLDELSWRGFDIRGIRILPEAIDLRSFYVYTDMYTRLTEDPAAHFTRLKQPFPQGIAKLHASQEQAMIVAHT